MRLFAAVDPPEAEIAALADAVSAVSGLATERLRHVPHEQWHVTTAFYGEVPESVVPELTERLGRAVARTTPLSLRISGVGTFPKRASHAKVLWAGLAGDVDELSRLADRCVAAGRRCGIAMEDRAYRPHLTIARVRGEPLDLRDAVAALASYDGQPWPVATLRLVHSTLGARVRHETMQEWQVSR